MNVWIAIENKSNGLMSVHETKNYQKSAYLEFMKNENDSTDFRYPNNINFTIKKFDTSGLKGEYKTFCVLQNNNKENHIMSRELDKLKEFVGFRNRLVVL